MILFKDDWKKYPRAIMDTETTNKTFLDLALKYKKMGIENHAFILALHNPELQGVDPHDPNLTNEQVGMIIAECKVNFWYFIREVARAPAQAGAPARRFIANRGNIALYWLFFNHVTVGLEQIRQTGKSFSADTLMTYLKNIRCSNTLINLLTKDNKVRMENIDRMRKIEKALPPYFRLTKEHGLDKDTVNTEMLTVKSLGNRYMTHVPQRNVMDAINQGRGLTSPIFQVDEAPFIANIEYSLPAALAAGGAVREIARANGEPFGTIITTTAGRLDDPSGVYIYNLFESSAPWSEHFMDVKDEAELYKVVRKQSSESKLRAHAVFNHRQLGYTDEWLQRKIEEALAKGDMMRMDYFGEWITGNSSNPLDTKTLESIKDSTKGDNYHEITDYGYVIRWHIPRNEIPRLRSHTGIVIGLDTSDAVGKDDIGLCIRDAYTGAVIGAGNFNETNIITFSEWLMTLFDRTPHAVLVPERRSTAIPIIDYLTKAMLAKGMNPLKHIFNWIVDDSKENPKYSEVISSKAKLTEAVITKYKDKIGFATSGSGRTSRDKLYTTTLTHAARFTGHLTHDPTLVKQISSLVEKNGRIDHTSGGKDDLVIAWLLTHWFITNARNISYYGLDPRKILHTINTNVNSEGKVMDAADLFRERQEQAAKEKISALMEELKATKDPLKESLLETRIRALSKNISSKVQSFNIDAIFEELKELKERNRVERRRRRGFR